VGCWFVGCWLLCCWVVGLLHGLLIFLVCGLLLLFYFSLLDGLLVCWFVDFWFGLSIFLVCGLLVVGLLCCWFVAWFVDFFGLWFVVVGLLIALFYVGIIVAVSSVLFFKAGDGCGWRWRRWR